MRSKTLKMLAPGLSSLAAIVGLFFFVMPAQAQATRTWVSGVGDDANPCSRTAPCKTFAGAISKTAAGGIINCIDPGGFGALTITKSITIDCTNTFAGILAAGTNGININAAGVVVILRGLSIEGVGTGLIGVNFINGAVLQIDKCKIFGFRGGTAVGIKFSPPTGVSSELYVADTVIEDNGTLATNGGILIQAIGSGNVNVVLERVLVKNNSAGIRIDGTGSTNLLNLTVRNSIVAGNTNNGITAITPAGGAELRVMVDSNLIVSNSGVGLNVSGVNPTGPASATVRVGGSTITANATGVSVAAAGVLRSYKTNFIDGNFASDGTPITAVGLN